MAFPVDDPEGGLGRSDEVCCGALLHDREDGGEWNPTVNVLLYLAVPLLYFVLVTALRDRPSTSNAAADFS